MSGRPPISCVSWKWGNVFAAHHVNVWRAMLRRHLHAEHRPFCVTDDSKGLDPDITVIPLPTTYAHTPRCRRRMWQFSRAFGELVGPRILSLDLDIVIVDDITDLVSRPEPIVGWRVGYANVYSGSVMLFDAGALDGAWRLFAADPDGYPRRVEPRGTPSDQAMVNHWLQTQLPIATWTERDGFVTYFGDGYERLEHHGVGPGHPELPQGARIVVLGSADKAVLDEGRFDWVRDHYFEEGVVNVMLPNVETPSYRYR